MFNIEVKVRELIQSGQLEIKHKLCNSKCQRYQKKNKFENLSISLTRIFIIFIYLLLKSFFLKHE